MTDRYRWSTRSQSSALFLWAWFSSILLINSLICLWSVIPIYHYTRITTSWSHGCLMCLYHLPVVQYHFLFDMEMHVCVTLTVTHTNASRQLCVCLLAISCVPGYSDIGSCPLRFLSLELGEDLTLCLLDTETSCIPAQEPPPKKREEYHQWKVMKNLPTITQSWSNVHCGITDDWCNWHCITNLTYSTEADDGFPADELKTLESLNTGKGDLWLI